MSFTSNSIYKLDNDIKILIEKRSKRKVYYRIIDDESQVQYNAKIREEKKLKCLYIRVRKYIHMINY
jgi:hypothetical protein